MNLLQRGHVRKQGPLPFQSRQRRSACQDQHGTDGEHHLALKLKSSNVKLVFNHIVPNKKSQSSQNNQHHYDRAHIPVPCGSREGRILSCGTPHKIKPSIAEGRHGVKEGKINPLPHSESGDKPGGQKTGPRQFHGQGPFGNELGHPHNAPNLRGGDGILHQGSLA